MTPRPAALAIASLCSIVALACSATDSSPPGGGGATSTGSEGGASTGAGGATGTGGSVLGTGGSAGGSPKCEPGAGGALPAVDCAQSGIVIDPAYAADYTCLDLGEHPSIPPKWGGLTTKLGDTSTLLLGGAANTDLGQLFEVELVRDAECHIVGFGTAPPVVLGEAAYNDGGVVYGPMDVLFLARWPVNQLGMQKPGSVATDKIVDTQALGVAYSLAALAFVPTGFGGAGKLKLVGWPGGEWYTATYAPDATGTFDISAVTQQTTIVGGPEGFVYIASGNAQFPNDGMLVSEWTANTIAAYEVDGDGNPVPASRKTFVTGLTGAEGAFLDPVSGDFLFSTFAAVNRVIAIRGFAPPAPLPN